MFCFVCEFQEKKRIWLELLVSQFYNMKRYGSLSVSVDVRNPNELKILKEVLLLWNEEMKDLEIIFKVYIFTSWFNSMWINLNTFVTHMSYTYLHFRTAMLLGKKVNLLSMVEHVTNGWMVKNHFQMLSSAFVLYGCIILMVPMKRNLH